MATKTFNTAWEKLEEHVRRECGRLSDLPNPTAEQCGEWLAYSKILIRMEELRPLDKKVDKS